MNYSENINEIIKQCTDKNMPPKKIWLLHSKESTAEQIYYIEVNNYHLFQAFRSDRNPLYIFDGPGTWAEIENYGWDIKTKQLLWDADMEKTETISQPTYSTVEVRDEYGYRTGYTKKVRTNKPTHKCSCDFSVVLTQGCKCGGN